MEYWSDGPESRNISYKETHSRCEKMMQPRPTRQISSNPSFPKIGTGARTMRILIQLKETTIRVVPF